MRLVDVGELGPDAAELAGRSKSDATLEAYRGHVRRYDAWCRAAPLTLRRLGEVCGGCLQPWGGDPESGAWPVMKCPQCNPCEPWLISSVGDYLADCLRRRHYGNSALSQALTALRLALQAGGVATTPEAWAPVRAVLKGAAVEIAGAPARTRGEAEPLRLVQVAAACVRLHGYMTGDGPELSAPVAARDRALLLLGYFGALRRDELVRLDVDDVSHDSQALLVSLRNAKASRGLVVHVTIPAGRSAATDPVGAWRDWLRLRPPALDLAGEPAWLRCNDGGAAHTLDTRRIGTGNTVTSVLRRALRLAGVDEWARYHAHSLRAGLATELAESGVSIVQVANAGRWDDLDTALRYARRARRLTDSPLRALAY